MDTKSDEFKLMIKKMNLESKTEYEQHKENQEQFKQLMPLLANLDEEEMRIFIHLLESKNNQMNQSKLLTTTLIDEACSDLEKKKLARLSEDENFALKNMYKHKKDTMQYAKKERMPIDESKVKDLLRNQHIFRD